MKENENLMSAVIGGAVVGAILYPIIRQATKSIAPELETLDAEKIIKALPAHQKEHHEHHEPHHAKPEGQKAEHTQSEVEALKRKLAELEKREGKA